MSAFQVNVQFNDGRGIKFGPSNIHTGREDGLPSFCTLAFGPKALDQDHISGPEVVLYFDRMEDVADLVLALQKLANDFAAATPDDAVVPIGAEAGKCLLCGIGTYPAVGSGPCSNIKCQGYSDAEEAAPITEPLIGGGVPRIEGEAE